MSRAAEHGVDQVHGHGNALSLLAWWFWMAVMDGVTWLTAWCVMSDPNFVSHICVPNLAAPRWSLCASDKPGEQQHEAVDFEGVVCNHLVVPCSNKHCWEPYYEPAKPRDDC